MQIYQLQTENDEEETWRDLVRAWSLFWGSYVNGGCIDSLITGSIAR